MPVAWIPSRQNNSRATSRILSCGSRPSVFFAGNRPDVCLEKRRSIVGVIIMLANILAVTARTDPGDRHAPATIGRARIVVKRGGMHLARQLLWRPGQARQTGLTNAGKSLERHQPRP